MQVEGDQSVFKFWLFWKA